MQSKLEAEQREQDVNTDVNTAGVKQCCGDKNSSGEAKRARERNREDLRRAEWLGGVSLCVRLPGMTVPRELHVAATWNVGARCCALGCSGHVAGTCLGQ